MMKSAFFLFVLLFNFENITSKSFLLHDNSFLDSDLVDEELGPKVESEERVVWKRIDMNSPLTNKEEINLGNDFLMQHPTEQSLQMMNENEDMTGKEMISKNEIAFDKQSFSDNSLEEISDQQNTIANDIGLDQLSATSLSVEFEPRNLTNAIIIDFSNVTGDAIVLDTFTRNYEDDVDEVSEMSKGDAIAFLHEMPTSSFEFLIDAQTRRNILLRELLGSQTILPIKEDDIELATVHELEPLSAIDSHSHGVDFQEPMLNKSVPVGDKSQVHDIEKDGSLNETATVIAEMELRNKSENIVPECPQPGWCIFWFLSQDTCEVNSHCLGSRICCKTGCSKTCVDV